MGIKRKFRDNGNDKILTPNTSVAKSQSDDFIPALECLYFWRFISSLKFSIKTPRMQPAVILVWPSAK